MSEHSETKPTTHWRSFDPFRVRFLARGVCARRTFSTDQHEKREASTLEGEKNIHSSTITTNDNNNNNNNEIATAAWTPYTESMYFETVQCTKCTFGIVCVYLDMVSVCIYMHRAHNTELPYNTPNCYDYHKIPISSISPFLAAHENTHTHIYKHTKTHTNSLSHTHTNTHVWCALPNI